MYSIILLITDKSRLHSTAIIAKFSEPYSKNDDIFLVNKLMLEVLTQLGQGNVVNITPIHAELTTQEGADILNISRPTFIKLLDSGVVPHSRTGNRRKVAYTDIMKYKEKLEEQRLQSLNELSALDQDIQGMGY